LPASSDDKLGKVNTLIKVKWPVVDNVRVTMTISKLLPIDVQTGLTTHTHTHAHGLTLH